MAEDMLKDDAEEPAPSFLCSYRLGIALIGFLVFLNNNMQRVSMSVAIICMVNQTAVYMDKEELNGPGNVSGLVPYDVLNNSTDVFGVYTDATQPEEPYCGRNTSDPNDALKDGPFAWDKQTQGHILGAYFYGYLVGQFPAGLLAERYGPKWPLTIFYSVATVATILTPAASYVSPILLIVLRIIIGIGSGALFPCMHTMWSRWAPPMERSKLAGITYAGCMAAAMVGLPLSGVLCKYGFSQGWDSIFYVIGCSSGVVLIPWVVMTSNSPSENTRVSSREKRYITASVKSQGTGDTIKRKFPWVAILKSGPMWAIVVANFCSDWGLYTFLTNIPTFLSEVLHFNIQSNGVFSALPFLGLWINMNVSPIIADKLRSTGLLNTTQTRKIFNGIGFLIPPVFLISLGFVECTQPILGVALLTVGVTFSGCAYTGFLVNHMDIGPPFAGTLIAITNGLGAMSGFIAPSVAAALTKNQTRAEWQVVFYIASGVYVFGAIIYIVFGSGEVQSWAHFDDIDPEEIDLKPEQVNGGHVVHVDKNGLYVSCNSVDKADTEDTPVNHVPNQV